MLRLAVVTLAVVAMFLTGSTLPVFAEGFIDLYLGAAVTRDSDVKATAFGVSETGRVEWDRSFTAGGRFGFWFESLDWLGLALDASFFKPDRDITVIPVSALAMLPTPAQGHRQRLPARAAPALRRSRARGVHLEGQGRFRRSRPRQ